MASLAFRRAFSSKLKRSLSNPRTSGTWPDSVVSQKVSAIDVPASDEDLSKYLKGILLAQSRIYEVCKETELQHAPGLSRMLKNNVYFKREDQQPVFSFKIRGAFNKIASLSEENRKKGIIACSAGNHAQGVALSASKLGLDNLIVMPQGAPEIKVESVKKLGGNVLLTGNNFDEAQATALKHSEVSGMTLVHPFDDFDIICGQGTIGMEILKQVPNKADAIFGCVGGGGLLAGIGSYVKQLSPHTEIIGCETFDANALTQSLEKKERKLLDEVGLFADGAAVRIPGKNCFSLCLRVVDKMINVTTDDICQAIKLIFNDTRIIVEPAGALGVAGLIKYVQLTGTSGKNLVAVISGANMDFDRLRFVSERADRSESLIHVKIPETKGAFIDLYKVIAPRNVTEFSYRMKDSPEADIILSFQAKSEDDKAIVLDALNDQGFKATDFSDNEIAKTHVRHLAAGRYDAENERLLSFEFPEGPGALSRFLQKLHQTDRAKFNVSLFHYRNHGDDIGRVLVGVQVPATEENAFADFLSAVDLVYTEETSNPAYLHFLRNTPTS